MQQEKVIHFSVELFMSLVHPLPVLGSLHQLQPHLPFCCLSAGPAQEPNLTLVECTSQVLHSVPLQADKPGRAERAAFTPCGPVSLSQPNLQPHTWTPGARPTPSPPGVLR